MQYGTNLAENMPHIMWQIQMEALQEISKSIKWKEIQSVCFWSSNWEEVSAIWEGEMIDIQQNGQVANQDGLYEVVVNGDGNGDLRIISVSRIMFS